MTGILGMCCYVVWEIEISSQIFIFRDDLNIVQSDDLNIFSTSSVQICAPMMTRFFFRLEEKHLSPLPLGPHSFELLSGPHSHQRRERERERERGGWEGWMDG
jgi:hypothetical protein